MTCLLAPFYILEQFCLAIEFSQWDSKAHAARLVSIGPRLSQYELLVQAPAIIISKLHTKLHTERYKINELIVIKFQVTLSTGQIDGKIKLEVMVENLEPLKQVIAKRKSEKHNLHVKLSTNTESCCKSLTRLLGDPSNEGKN